MNWLNRVTLCFHGEDNVFNILAVKVTTRRPFAFPYRFFAMTCFAEESRPEFAGWKGDFCSDSVQVLGQSAFRVLAEPSFPAVLCGNSSDIAVQPKSEGHFSELRNGCILQADGFVE